MTYDFIVNVVLVIISVVFVEGLTELVVKSSVFSGFREWASRKGGLIQKLIACGYCFSVWASLPPAAFLAAITTGSVAFKVLSFFGYVVILHRSSNYLHNFNDKHLDKYYSKEKETK